MGITTKATQNRSPPLSLRSQKGLPRQSPQSRLRSRSYSHDNELYRMGLRKNAAGEWAETDNLPTAGIAAAMRSMRIKSIKREMSEEVRERDERAEREESVDMEDSTAVYEEIQVYMEITGSRDLELVDIDGATNMEEAKEMLQSVEAKIEVKGEVKMEFEDDAYALPTLPGIDEEGETIADGGTNSNINDNPPEFNEAISYVRRIKARFKETPEVYRQFLEILQTYERESTPLKDVYVQFTTLFIAAPELLEEFSKFLPKSAAQRQAAAAKAAEETATQVPLGWDTATAIMRSGKVNAAKKRTLAHLCPYCELEKFSRPDQLRRHIRKDHGIYESRSLASKDGNEDSARTATILTGFSQ